VAWPVPGRRDHLAEGPLREQRDHDVVERGQGQELADLRAGEQGHVHEEEDGLQRHADDDPRVREHARDHAAEAA
jgi:hypothetical protein